MSNAQLLLTMWMALVRTGMHVCEWKKFMNCSARISHCRCTSEPHLPPWERSFFWRLTVSHTMHGSEISLPSRICQCRPPLAFAAPAHPFRTKSMTHGRCRRLKFSMDANCRSYRSLCVDRVDRGTASQRRRHLRPIAPWKRDSHRHAVQDCCHGTRNTCIADGENKTKSQGIRDTSSWQSTHQFVGVFHFEKSGTQESY